MTIEAPISIGNIIRNAIVFDPKNWRGGAVDENALLHDVERLFELLDERRIEYVLVGGIAILQYIEGRNTEDIDLIMALASLKKLPEIKLTSQDKDFARGQLDQLQIDFLLTRNRLFEKVRRQFSVTRRFLERDIVCATVEGLLLLKLYALPSLYRQGNFVRVGLYENDVATLMFQYQTPIEPLLAILAQYLSETDLDAVRGIVADIQQRIERFRRGFTEGE